MIAAARARCPGIESYSPGKFLNVEDLSQVRTGFAQLDYAARPYVFQDLNHPAGPAHLDVDLDDDRLLHELLEALGLTRFETVLARTRFTNPYSPDASVSCTRCSPVPRLVMVKLASRMTAPVES